MGLMRRRCKEKKDSKSPPFFNVALEALQVFGRPINQNSNFSNGLEYLKETGNSILPDDKAAEKLDQTLASGVKAKVSKVNFDCGLINGFKDSEDVHSLLADIGCRCLLVNPESSGVISRLVSRADDLHRLQSTFDIHSKSKAIDDSIKPYVILYQLTLLLMELAADYQPRVKNSLGLTRALPSMFIERRHIETALLPIYSALIASKDNSAILKDFFDKLDNLINYCAFRLGKMEHNPLPLATDAFTVWKHFCESAEALGQLSDFSVKANGAFLLGLPFALNIAAIAIKEKNDSIIAAGGSIPRDWDYIGFKDFLDKDNVVKDDLDKFLRRIDEGLRDTSTKAFLAPLPSVPPAAAPTNEGAVPDPVDFISVENFLSAMPYTFTGLYHPQFDNEKLTRVTLNAADGSMYFPRTTAAELPGIFDEYFNRNIIEGGADRQAKMAHAFGPIQMQLADVGRNLQDRLVKCGLTHEDTLRFISGLMPVTRVQNVIREFADLNKADYKPAVTKLQLALGLANFDSTAAIPAGAPVGAPITPPQTPEAEFRALIEPLKDDVGLSPILKDFVKQMIVLRVFQELLDREIGTNGGAAEVTEKMGVAVYHLMKTPSAIDVNLLLEAQIEDSCDKFMCGHVVRDLHASLFADGLTRIRSTLR